MITFNHIRHYLGLWDWRLFVFILLFLGLPNVYQLYRVYLVGNELPGVGGLAIVSQWQFVGLVVEVFQGSHGPGDFLFPGLADPQRRGGATGPRQERLDVHLYRIADFRRRGFPVPRRIHHVDRNVGGNTG